MAEKREPNDLTIEELEQLLYLKKRSRRRQRLQRLKADGRVVEVEGLPAPDSAAYAPSQEEEPNGHESIEQAAGSVGAESTDIESEGEEAADAQATGAVDGALLTEDAGAWKRIGWRKISNRLLLIIEIAAVVGLVTLAFLAWQTVRELNTELAEVQEAQSISAALPTATATPVIGVVVLPSGHRPPVNGRPAEPGEAGYIPPHLLPILNSYVPPPIPTPGPEQARRLQIPAINVDKPIVQGDDWEQLKKGVGQYVGSTLPGREGNVVLSAHNDIYGEIFRHLDRLKPGDEVIISTERQSYTYVVNEIQVVEPTDVWVMAPTEHARTTLISCYPYLINNKRIVIFADLATSGTIG